MDSLLQDRLDRNYRYQRHVYDLTREYYLLGRDRLIATLDVPHGGTALEIGCGTARNLILAAKRYPAATFFGIDLSQMMLEVATRKLAASRIGPRVTLARGDATSFDAKALFGIERGFDRIFFSYALSMIPHWQAALEHAAAHLAPGGSLHIVDFGNGEALPSAANAMLRAWLARFHVTPRDGLGAYLTDLAARRSAALTVTPVFRSYAIAAVLTVPSPH